ncbi:MAG: hypothetical protein CBD97_02220 [Pelagibacteraceae bacterium TMED237]|nr:MAG: hypothetical protein CBD97_02220 [Pelagibacteraceae bacterium TMED237]|tara:strand:- start:8431 stop:9090 length:660 start_codon:yes stop_codon:yes gene_type:complete
MIKNIIFDFDGVIVDSEILASKAYAKYFNNLGYSLVDEQFYNYSGMKTVEVIDILTKKYQISDKNKFSADIFKIISNNYTNNLRLVEGVKEYLTSSNKKHFIGSNSNYDRILDGLNTVELNNIFPPSSIYSFDMVNHPKPKPDIYLKILKDNNLNTEETIIIEDSGVGAKAGKLAGVRVIGITAGKHWHSKRDENELYNNGVIKVLSSFKDLNDVLEGL